MIRIALRKKWIWVQLPILFAICFIVPNSTGAANFYRVLIILPLLVCFQVKDMREIWAHSPSRWIIFLCGWLTLTLMWDGLGYKDFQYLARELNVLALFYLGYLVNRYHGERLTEIPLWFLGFGVIGVMLIIQDWQGLQYINTEDHHRESAWGIFGHHVYVGWIVAVLSIVALDLWLKSNRSITNSLYLFLFLFLSGMTFFVQARGGYAVYAVGVILTLGLSPGRKSLFLISTCVFAAILVGVAFSQEVQVILQKIVERGTSNRFAIWQEGFAAVTESWQSLLFGHGLSVSTEFKIDEFANYVFPHFHSFYLNHTFYGGLVGLFLYLGLLFNALIMALRNPKVRVWGIILVAMQAAFITDGDAFFENPSATLLCLLMPMALLIFNSLTPAKNSSNHLNRVVNSEA